MKVLVLTAIDNSLYTRLILELCHREAGITVSGIVVRRVLDLNRIRQEWKRDGTRLLRKVWEKILFGKTEPVVPKTMATPQKRAEELGIEYDTVSAVAKVRGIPLCWANDFNAVEVIEFAKSIQPDVTIFSGGGLIRKDLLTAAGQGVLNVHLGLLPEYRGMDVVEWPILMEGAKGLDQIGFTLYFMNRGVDTGPIVATQQFAIDDDDNFTRIRLRLGAAMADTMIAGLRALRDGKLESVHQSKRDGRQYFVCHSRITELAHRKLSAALQSRTASRNELNED